jgi:hypothetical protein
MLLTDHDEEEEEEDWEWKLVIKKIDNGFLLKGNGLDSLREEAIVERSKQECDYDEHIQNALLAMDLLHAVQEYFSLDGSKYDRRRCHVILVPGTKVEGEEDNFNDKEHNWLYHWLKSYCDKCGEKIGRK